MSRFWAGADPGGDKKFGLAFLDTNGGLDCATVSSVDDAVDRIASKGEPLGLGIDAPMWWSSCQSGRRKADDRVRKAVEGKCNRPSGTVQWINSLRGAALAGGAMLAFRLRQKFPCVPITESHPKALMYALELEESGFAKRFGISRAWCNEHERDAAVAAVCAREGFEGRWPTDLSRKRNACELDPRSYWLASVHYFWPK